MSRFIVILPLLAVAGAGCKDKTDIKVKQSASETFAQVEPTAVDILWIVDDSVSMSEEQLKVQEGSGLFVDTFGEAEVDFHLGVTTTDIPGDAGMLVGDPPYLTPEDATYADDFRDRIDVGLAGDSQESGLEAGVLALTPPNSNDINAGFLRPEAKLSIIVLSDEDDCSEFGTADIDTGGQPACADYYADLTPVSDIVAMLWALKADAAMVQVSGIVERPDTECSTADPGTRYYEAVEMTNGVAADICAADYDSIMDELGLRAAGVLYEFELANPALESSIEAWVNPGDSAEYEVMSGTMDGWTFTDSPPTVKFHGTAVPPRGSTVTISYEY